jgi:predicted DNA-binding transcriptional regulator AlpA
VVNGLYRPTFIGLGRQQKVSSDELVRTTVDPFDAGTFDRLLSTLAVTLSELSALADKLAASVDLARREAGRSLKDNRPLIRSRGSRQFNYDERAEGSRANQSELPPTEPARLLTIEETVRQYSISRTGLYKLISSGQLPDVVVAGRRLFPRDALEALIAGKRK